uniref:Uncharacterized protein n=1 Tax=Schistocephalus solidus TaxID=70667 RepID=A0A0X3NMD7_SCHSO
MRVLEKRFLGLQFRYNFWDPLHRNVMVGSKAAMVSWFWLTKTKDRLIGRRRLATEERETGMNISDLLPVLSQFYIEPKSTKRQACLETRSVNSVQTWLANFRIRVQPSVVSTQHYTRDTIILQRSISSV